MSSDFRQLSQDKVMIMSAPNGARRGHADHPALPVTPDESARDAIALRDAGVSILHLHVRDRDGKHTLDPERYREAIVAVRKVVGDELVIQATTEAVGMYAPAQQMAVVRELKPEAVSVALREICPTGAEETVAAGFFAWMRGEGIWPQYILYSVADVARFEDMRRRGVFADDAPFVMFVLGAYADAVAGQVAELDKLLDAADATAFPWAVCCFGAHENDVMQAATARGGHVRLGFENNLLLADGSLAPDNAALIREYRAGIGSGKRVPATAEDVRAAFLRAS